ncbi:hypothetical protein NE237_014269 [Protea cynaroides]|uniref:Uncharacterized protein n=1 Tax=Protea cynaroides TaxID=273540 RepID=A0A9Q0JTR3_9MAGN|nr:hypothetical protein NE237_014269 [Protea cynaroides]
MDRCIQLHTIPLSFFNSERRVILNENLKRRAGKNLKPLGFGLFRTFLVSNMVACGNYYVASFFAETCFIRPNTFQQKPRMKVVEDERYIFTSSMLGLLAEYDYQPTSHLKGQLQTTTVPTNFNIHEQN